MRWFLDRGGNYGSGLPGEPPEIHGFVLRKSAEIHERRSIRQDRREEVIHGRMSLFGIDLLGKIHRALHVGEENSHLLSLPFEGSARGQDLLGEVFRRVAARLRWWRRFRGLSDPRSAIPAELFFRLVLRLAGGANEGQPAAALGAELSAGSILPAIL
jgi:hypothetical protein